MSVLKLLSIWGLCTTVLCFQSVLAQSKVNIELFMYPIADLQSINGSFSNGVCSEPINDTDMDSLHLGGCDCEPPASCVLFDGNIPMLTGLDGDTWASQLFTMKTSHDIRDVYMHQKLLFIVDHRDTIHDRIVGVEVALFNCPWWGLGVHSIQLLGNHYGSSFVASTFVPIATKEVQQASCDSLVRVHIPLNTTLPILALRLLPYYDSEWTQIAEITFYGHIRREEGLMADHTHSDTISGNEANPLSTPPVDFTSSEGTDSAPSDSADSTTNPSEVIDPAHSTTASLNESPTSLMEGSASPLGGTAPKLPLTKNMDNVPASEQSEKIGPAPCTCGDETCPCSFSLLRNGTTLAALAIMAAILLTGCMVAVYKYRSKYRVRYKRVHLQDQEEL